MIRVRVKTLHMGTMDRGVAVFESDEMDIQCFSYKKFLNMQPSNSDKTSRFKPFLIRNIRTAGQGSVSGRSCDQPSQHRFSWFACVYKQMLRWFPRLQVATACFSCSSPPLIISLIHVCVHVYNHCHQASAQFQ